MTVISLYFPAGRFHGTPWGRHVNEGAVEWPPSPWRLLRALLAVWYLKANEVPESVMRRLLSQLAAVPPSYTLPQASQGHTRHYLPFNEGRNEKTTKVFDTFIHISSETRLLIHWDIALDSELHSALSVLLTRLSYFGRAESLVEGCLLNPETENILPPNSFPMLDEAALPVGKEVVRLLVPLSSNEYALWREGYLSAAKQFVLSAVNTESKSSAKIPRTFKKLPIPQLPPDLFTALHADTGELQATGWAVPPGARLLAFVRSASAFDITPVRRRSTLAEKSRPTVARYAINSAVLPRLTKAVSVADRVHKSLIKWSDNHSIFTGRNEDGLPSRSNHGHAHVFCEVSERRDTITHLTIFAREGFDLRAQLALRQLNKVWGHGGHDLQLVLLGFGNPVDFAGSNTAAGQSAIFQESEEWVSLTPFVPTRHGKLSANRKPKLDDNGWQIGGPAHDLLRLLRLLKPDSEPQIVQSEDAAPTYPLLRWLQFQQRRATGDGLRASVGGSGYRIRFARKVTGPIAVGYGSHFGLGLFCPESTLHESA